MQRVAYLSLFTGLLCLPSSVLAQNDNPFGGSDPFARPPRVKPDTQKNVAQPAPVQAGVTVLAKPHDSSSAVRHIREALGHSTSQSFIKIPLQDAIQQISDTHRIPVVIDRRALEEIGLSVDEPVTLSLRDVSLRSFLRLLLRDLDLTYMIKDDVMQVTTFEAAERNLVVEMYRFSDDLTEQSDEIVKALTATIVPDAWDVLGGPCTVTNVENVLIVSATENIHEQVRSFLDKLKNAFEGDDTDR